MEKSMFDRFIMVSMLTLAIASVAISVKVIRDINSVNWVKVISVSK